MRFIVGVRRSPMRVKFTFLVLLVGCGTGPVSGDAGGPSDPTPSTPPELAVEVSGSGRPIVFIPGLASSGEVWSSIVAGLQPSYSCHVLTLAGFAGRPPIPPPFLSKVR